MFATTWIAAVAFGLRLLFQYESMPGPVGALPQEWPGVQIERATDRPTLVMLAHPRCPCTAASVDELARIMARLQGKVAAYVLLVKPSGSGLAWEDTNLRRNAEAIPGVRVLFDSDGVAARRFGAETSGHTLLFGAKGNLLFSGGITSESAIVALANNQTPAQARTLVFGCSLASTQRDSQALCLK